MIIELIFFSCIVVAFLVTIFILKGERKKWKI